MPTPPLAPVTLANAHARLEPLTRGHLSALCEVGLDPALWEWTVSRVADEADLRRWVEQALAEQAAGVALPFAVVDPATGRVAGSTRYGNYAPAHDRVEIGWTWVGRPWQRTRLNTAAKRLLLAHAFETLGVRRVELKTDALNRQSRAAIGRIGAREEGTLRQHTVTESGRVRDTVYFSVLASEWPAVRDGLDRRLADERPSGASV